MSVSKKHRFQLNIQNAISMLVFPILFPMIIFWLKHIKKYRIHDLKTIREQFKKIKSDTSNGLLICPNHLTFVDSIILVWALSTPWSYMTHFKSLCWNLPKASHVKESKLYRTICYLGKCILIEQNTKASKLTMDKASYLLNNGHYVMVFPEGTRSNTGRINTENFIYGVGKLHIDSGIKSLLSIYLRGDSQETASKMPRSGEKFTINMKLIEANSEQKGRRAMRDVASSMIDELVDLESQYFATK